MVLSADIYSLRKARIPLAAGCSQLHIQYLFTSQSSHWICQCSFNSLCTDGYQRNDERQ